MQAIICIQSQSVYEQNIPERGKNWSAPKCKALGIYINKGSHICIWIQLGKMKEITGPDFLFLNANMKHWMTNNIFNPEHTEHLHLYIQQTSLSPTMNSLSYSQVCSLFIVYLSKRYHHPFGCSNKKFGYYLWLFCLTSSPTNLIITQVPLILPSQI